MSTSRSGGCSKWNRYNRGSLAETGTSEREIPSRPEIGRTSDISPLLCIHRSQTRISVRPEVTCDRPFGDRRRTYGWWFLVPIIGEAGHKINAAFMRAGD